MFETSDFCHKLPSHQNSIDLFPRWASSFPVYSGLQGGHLPHFEDARVTWAAERLGGFSGKNILELGPFEAYNTYQFEIYGASSVLALESNIVNYMKCLVVKNAFNLKSVFLLGDFVKYLDETNNTFDVCWASGVLYHLKDPVHFLKAISKTSNSIFLWTQYYIEEKIAGTGNEAFFDRTKDKIDTSQGFPIHLHWRSYNEVKSGYFSGGPEDYSYWMGLDDILKLLKSLGFGDISMGVNNVDYSNGPACFFIAKRG
ncbi:DUF1698 domain-containing protein [Niveispirillum sp. SYP-B3756]|uniref:DUF1698 domain-containing protein n=1 Tax=Niveispirillum sp. SYP-B3756 TaxID=2662178 RepID=UPI001291F230|nr:class I SAM-dependent methyltransferase [Niveispirillum sp. SYP-B3756]MQP64085.1 DUF1698 domain-containing protein [Niveispirillum sp. SYP-B3756]